MLSKINKCLDEQDIRGVVACLNELVSDAGIEAVAARSGLTAEQVHRSLRHEDRISVQDARKVLHGLGLTLAVVSDQNKHAKGWQVEATWDDDCSVWVATSSDVPGLVTESKTLEELCIKLKKLVPELVEENGLRGDEKSSVELIARRKLDL